MASTKCNQCPDEKPPSADMYCVDCQLFLCLRCFQIHKRVPSLMKHNFITSENAAEMIQKDINNQAHAKASNVEPVNKILASRNTLEKMLQGIHSTEQPWNVRNIKENFIQKSSRLKPVKIIRDLQGNPYRIGIVNKNLWIRDSRLESSVVVYDQDLNQLTQHRWKQIYGVCTCQQVSDTDVMVASTTGLHIVDTEGRYQYKVMDGLFSDITQDDHNVAVIEYQQNEVIFLINKESKWQSQSQIVFRESDKNIKTLHLLHSNKLFVAVYMSHKILEIDTESRRTVQQYGTGNEGCETGEFHFPKIIGANEQHLIVSDQNNARFLVLESNRVWHEVILQGQDYPMDGVIVENCMFVLDRIGTKDKLTKYQAPV